MTDLGGIFGAGKEAATQIFIWQVAAQIMGALMTPVVNEMTRAVNLESQTTPLSPPQLADMVVRRFISMVDAENYAKQSGIAPSDFQRMVDAAADAPSPGELAEALRRGLIPESGTGADSTSFEQGIAEGRLGNKWAPMIKGLSQIWPTPIDALDALLEGQVDQATGEALYQKFGGDPDYFTMLFNTRGSAPTPMEALEMAKRGIIPWDGSGPDATSFYQAFLEGPWRNKWEPAFRALGTPIPPTRTITALVRAGSISDQQALTWWGQQGYDQATAEAFLADAKRPTTHPTPPHITASEIQQLYTDQLISQTQAEGMLQALGYSQADAQAIAQLAAYTLSRSQLNSAITRIRSLYDARKIDRGTAQSSLNSLHVAQAQVTALLDQWDIERAAAVRVLSESQVASALFYEVITQEQAMAQLEAMGYTAHDAWVVLSVRNRGPLPDEPAA